MITLLLGFKVSISNFDGFLKVNEVPTLGGGYKPYPDQAKVIANIYRAHGVDCEVGVFIPYIREFGHTIFSSAVIVSMCLRPGKWTACCRSPYHQYLNWCIGSLEQSPVSRDTSCTTKLYLGMPRVNGSGAIKYVGCCSQVACVSRLKLGTDRMRHM